MIAYLDTSAAVCLAAGTVKILSRAAKHVVETSDLLISPMVLVELEFLYEIRRIKLSSRDIQRKIAEDLGVTVCDFSFLLVAGVAVDEKWTRDPFDRIIVAHAKANGFATLISADQFIAVHYPRTVW